MFRIDKVEANGSVTLTLAGVLNASAAVEAANAMGGPLRENRRLALDLSQLRYADREGIRFLATAMRNGVHLTGVPQYVGSWLRQEGLRQEGLDSGEV
jgi:ABC-type transporter Mla MlaB component